MINNVNKQTKNNNNHMKLFPELSFLTRRNGNLGDKSSITFSRDVISGIVQPTELPFYD